MKRRSFLKQVAIGTTTIAASLSPNILRATEEPRAAGGTPAMALDAAVRKDWLARWEKNIVSDSRNRYCDKETGEELGWQVSPFLNGFYYGYLATQDPKWVESLIDWTDSCLKRGVKEPDGFTG